MIKSLRWRIQVWYSLILMAVLTVYGGAVYYLQWQSRLADLDVRMEQTGELLVSRLIRLQWPNNPNRWPRNNNNRRRERPLQPRPQDGGNQARLDFPTSKPLDLAPRQSPGIILVRREVVVVEEAAPVFSEPSANKSEFNSPSTPQPEKPPVPNQLEPKLPGEPQPPRNPGFGENLPPMDRGPPGPPPDGGRPPPPPPSVKIPLVGKKIVVNSEDLVNLGFPDELALLFDENQDYPAYFSVWDHRGNIALQTSTTPPEVYFPTKEANSTTLFIREFSTNGNHRELALIPRFGFKVVLGEPLTPIIRAQHATGLGLLLVGGGVLAVGLIGGSWYSNRAMAPIRQMTTTAESISGRNLTERINVQETDTELGSLATVLNQTFGRLQEAFEQQARFTADASHELRTPVAILVSQTELTLSRTRSQAEYEEALQTCRRTALRMRTLVEGLLFLARIDAGETDKITGEFDLAAMVEECVADLAPLAEQRELTIEMNLAPARVRSNRSRMIQVLTNLVTNAIRYNRPPGKIVVRVKSDGPDAVLVVEDTGIGISNEDLPHVFERFYRVDKARTLADGGTGLGLAICKTIVESFGGTISVASRLDQGTTVEVRIPRSSA